MFTLEQLQTIFNLIIAGGKSPATGADGVLRAAEAISWIKERERELLGRPQPAAPPALPVAPVANGAEAH